MVHLMREAIKNVVHLMREAIKDVVHLMREAIKDVVHLLHPKLVLEQHERCPRQRPALTA